MKRKNILLLVILTMFAGTSCNNPSDIPTNSPDEEQMQQSVQKAEQDLYKESKEIAECYREIYEQAKNDGTLGTLDTMKNIVECIGAAGYVVVDADNQLDMINSDKLMDFIEKVNDKKEAEVILICVLTNGGFNRFVFETSQGRVHITRSYLAWNGNTPVINSHEYDAYTWEYSEDGYLLFEEYYMPGLDSSSDHTAVRVQPLDEKCRELNRQYILPIGYGLNNMFTVDWSEADFSSLDFYDLFDKLYPEVNNVPVSFLLEDNLGGEALYCIPKDEFEKVIMLHFKIDSKTLQSKTKYLEGDQSYEYRPRGLYDNEPPNYPFPEVVAYAEDADGTLTLTVHAVYPDRNLSKVYAHEVVIRPLTNGEFQYVSNHIIPSQDNYEVSWRKDRLTAEEWEEIELETIYDKGYDLPVTEEERKKTEEDCKSAMNKIRDIYRNAYKGDASNAVITDETAEKMMDILEDIGNPISVGVFSSGMYNYSEMESFLKSCENELKGEIITYQIHTDGSIGRLKFIFDGKDMYALSTSAAWNREDKPSIVFTSYSRIKQWRYTDKGWFCFEYCVPEPPEVTEVVNGNVLLRVRPLDNDYRELADKWLLPLSYQGNNLLRSNWDAEQMEAMDYNGLFQYLYMIKYRKAFESETYENGIPKEDFENMMMEYLPVTIDTIRKYATFDEEAETYSWVRLACGNYTPTLFGTSVPEIVDMKENEDGTVTLTIDAVCELTGEEAAISHKLTLEFKEDGTVKYLKNKILNDGINQIPAYQYRFK